MAATRRRFTPAEREQFTAGTAVEWLDASHWKPGLVAAPPSPGIERDSDGQETLGIVNLARTGFVRYGEVTRVLPKHVRVPGCPGHGEYTHDELVRSFGRCGECSGTVAKGEDRDDR